MLLVVKADLTAFSDFPHGCWRKIWSTNSVHGALQPQGQETDRRRWHLPQPRGPAAFVEVRTHIEAHDEWQDSDRRYLSEESMALLRGPEPAPLPHQTRQAGHQRLDRGVLQPQSQARLGGDEVPIEFEKSSTSRTIAAEPNPRRFEGKRSRPPRTRLRERRSPLRDSCALAEQHATSHTGLGDATRWMTGRVPVARSRMGSCTAAAVA